MGHKKHLPLVDVGGGEICLPLTMLYCYPCYIVIAMNHRKQRTVQSLIALKDTDFDFCGGGSELYGGMKEGGGLTGEGLGYSIHLGLIHAEFG